MSPRRRFAVSRCADTRFHGGRSMSPPSTSSAAAISISAGRSAATTSRWRWPRGVETAAPQPSRYSWRRRKDRGVLPRPWLPARERRRARDQAAAGFRRSENAVGRAEDSDHRGTALQSRQLRGRRQHRCQDRLPEAAVQDELRRVVRREAHPQGPRESTRGVRQRRLLRVHGLPRLQVPRRSESESA